MFDFSLRFNAIDRVSSRVRNINSEINRLRSTTERANQRISTMARQSFGRMETLARRSRDNLASMFSHMDFRASISLSTVQARQRLNSLNARMRSTLNSISMSGRQLAGSFIPASVAMLASVGIPLDAARKYELAFKDVKKAVAGTPEELAKLRIQMLEFRGASFEELAAVTAEAGKMGFNAKNVNAFTDSVIKGAKALDFDAVTAVEQVGKILSMTNQMGTAVESSRDIMDKVANLENNLAGVKGAGIIDVWKRSADVFSQLDFDNNQMGAMAAFLEQTSVSSELGASGFKIMINKFKELDGQLGFFTRIKSKGLEGLKDVMGEINKMSPDQLKGFGSEALTLINKLQNGDNMKKLEFALGVSKDSMGAVDKEWELYRATFDEKMKDSLRGVTDLAESVGKPMMALVGSFLTKVTPIITKIKKWVEGNKALVKTLLKITFAVGAFLFVAGVLALVFGVTAAALSALSPLLLIVTGRFGLLAGVTWLVNSAMLANPMVWMVIGVIGLISAIGALIYYWSDFTTWVGVLWDKFMLFTGIGELFSSIGSYIMSFVAPVTEVIDLIDGFISKLDVFQGAKNLVSSITGGAMSWANVGDESHSKVDNVNKAHTVIDVNILSPDGVTTETTEQSSTGGVTLRTIDNGIG